MPLISPQGLHEVLKEAKIVNGPAADHSKIREILNEKGLSLADTVDNLREISTSGNEHLKLRATELVLKMHGALDNGEQKGPVAIQFLFPSGDNQGLINVLVPRS